VEFIGGRAVYRHERFHLDEETFRTPVALAWLGRWPGAGEGASC